MSDAPPSAAPPPVEDAPLTWDDLRQMGNHQFQQEEYKTAVLYYTQALELLLTDESQQVEENVDAVIVNLCNRSAAYARVMELELARDDAKQAWQLSDRKNAKAAYRLAKTQHQLGQTSQALSTLETTLSLLEDDDDKCKALRELKTQLQQAASKPSQPEDETSICHVTRPVSIREFNKSTELGVGNFSEIITCTHKNTKEVFALKIIAKAKAKDLAKRQHPNVWNEIAMERRILLERLPHHKYIIRLYHAFEDYENLYLLLEYHPYYLWNQVRLQQTMVGCYPSLAQFWLLQLIDAIEHLHSHGIVHRDLKTENVLLDERGNVIVIDFGTAKDLIQTDLNGPEFVGTPDFMSPEAVLAGKDQIEPCGVETDLWALGGMAYSMLTGETPFWSPSPYLTFLKIPRANLRKSWALTDAAMDFCQSLLRVRPQDRLGAGTFTIQGKTIRRVEQTNKNGYQALREHAFFQNDKKPCYGNGRVPSLRDLCVRAVATMVQQDADNLELCDQHPPGDKSRHDLLRLGQEDRKAVLHVLDKLQVLKRPRIWNRFFASTITARLGRLRHRDFVGLTRMNDGQYKPPSALIPNDGFSTPPPPPPTVWVYLQSPLFASLEYDGANKEELRRLKECIKRINRTRPKLVVVSCPAGKHKVACGLPLSDKVQKFLAKISDSIPVIIGSTYSSFWHSGIQGLHVTSWEQGPEQTKWLQEHLEQSRMAKHKLFCFCDNLQALSTLTRLRLARGRTLCLMGLSDHQDIYNDSVEYRANATHQEEGEDAVSVKSTDSDEDEADNSTMLVKGTRMQSTCMMWLTIDESKEWESKLEDIN